MSRRNVDHVNVRAGVVHLLHRVANQLLEMHFALADAAPSDRVEVIAIDEFPDRRFARRLVAINVIERAAGIESGVVPEFDSLGQRAADLHRRARGRPIESTRRQHRQRRRQSILFFARLPTSIGVRDVDDRRLLIESRADEAAREPQRFLAIFFAERVVKKTGKDVALFDRAAEAVEEFVLRLVMDHEVGAGD